jgi:hypothetical protein
MIVAVTKREQLNYWEFRVELSSTDWIYTNCRVPERVVAAHRLTNDKNP